MPTDVLTLGENIADHGGLLVAHQAYLNSLKGKETPAPIDGFTNEQRFFLGYATLWGQNIRPEEIRRRTKIDPHSLGKWRVNAPCVISPRSMPLLTLKRAIRCLWLRLIGWLSGNPNTEFI